MATRPDEKNVDQAEMRTNHFEKPHARHRKK